ncbi:MAG TPA: hypothetical protein VEV43_02945 [Actinomycetota bacterium]|nr:hypothetical protein [Actinomycetota bacterium]
MTEQERRRRIEKVKESARLTDEMLARNEAALDLALARLRLAAERLTQAR